ncbi:uncharacterized protein LOC144870088 isoform X4 [Branchiostoma floridae x Branchiostoma japonicum]
MSKEMEDVLTLPRKRGNVVTQACSFPRKTRKAGAICFPNGLNQDTKQESSHNIQYQV